MTKPLAFIDIDGVLNRMFFASPYDALALTARHLDMDGHDYLLFVDPDDARRLARLEDHFDLAWGTSWEDDAPRVADLIGVDSRHWIVARRQAGDGDIIKSPSIMRAAAGREFVWIDDEVWPDDLVELANYESACATIVVTDPSRGLNDSHIDTAIDWALRRTTTL